MNSHNLIMSEINRLPINSLKDSMHSLDERTFAVYMNTLGLDAEKPLPLTIQTVEMLLYRHASRFAFATFPANFGDQVRLTATDLTEYMLRNGQGYCFHHNVSIGAALKKLGFDITFVAASIRKSQEPNDVFQLATHVVVILHLDKEDYLIDPGWSDGIVKALPLNEKSDQASGKYYAIKLSNEKYGLAQKTDESFEIKYEFTCTSISLDSFNEALANVMGKDHLFYGLFFYSIVTGHNEICSIANHLFTRSTLDGKILESVEYNNLNAIDILRKHFSPESKVLLQISGERFINQKLAKLVLHPANDNMPTVEIAESNNQNHRSVL